MGNGFSSGPAKRMTMKRRMLEKKAFSCVFAPAISQTVDRDKAAPNG